MAYLDFEVFAPKLPKEKIPHINLSKNGTLVFSSQARRILNIPLEGFAEIAYNRDNKILRIKIIKEKGCIVKNWRIFAGGFYNQFNISKDSIGKYPFSQIDNEDQAYYVDLKDTSLLTHI
jgi:hypothetical protein